MLKAVCAGLVGTIAFAPALWAQDAVEVFKQVSPSVVGLSNLGGGGAGIILDRSGLILTNAHVVATPLPVKCVAEVMRDGKPVQVTFARVQVVGMHPHKDLALVRINPQEHSGELRPAKIHDRKATPGQKVYAIGNPAAGPMVLNKTITSGLISGVDRQLEGVTYYQVDAAINPGNSGGPIVNDDGEVLGIATLKFEDVDRVGFAIPLNDFRRDEFKAPQQRAGNPQLARQYVQRAKSFAQMASDLRRSQPDDPQAKLLLVIAAGNYHEALTHDPSNWTIYFNCGLLHGSLDEPEVAAAYMLQAIEVSPWGHESDVVYRQLGIYLKEQGKTDQAASTWREGLAKYPRSGYCWELWARRCLDENQFYDAAFAAAVVLHLRPRNSNQKEMQRVWQAAARQLDQQEHQRLNRTTSAMASELTRRVNQAAHGRQNGKVHLTQPFEQLVNNIRSETELVDQEMDGDLQAVGEDRPEPPKKQPGRITKQGEFRFWVDDSGEYQVEARFLELIEGVVRLEKKAGGIIDVPLDKLSGADQKYVKRNFIDDQ